LIRHADQRLGRACGETLSRDPLFSDAEDAVKYTAAMRRSSHKRKNRWGIKQLERISAVCRFYTCVGPRVRRARAGLELAGRNPVRALRKKRLSPTCSAVHRYASERTGSEAARTVRMSFAASSQVFRWGDI
jgi:hypothetical protein